MQNNPNGPYDEMFNNLAKIVDEIIRNMPEAQHARIIGYTIVTRHATGDPKCFRCGENADSGDIPYEVVETDTDIFITAVVPPDAVHMPFADIQKNAVHISVDDRTTAIMLNQPIDVFHSAYRVHHGVMDITLKKAPQV
jgi:HSP20 family molecular chaperone IbpA